MTLHPTSHIAAACVVGLVAGAGARVGGAVNGILPIAAP